MDPNLIILLIPFLITVESAGDANAVNGDAVGILQIRECVVSDLNRICKSTVYLCSDRWSKDKSVEMCKLYLLYYGNRYERKTGNKATFEVLSRIWNGGPDGYSKRSTKVYWYKVRDAMCSRVSK